MKKPRTWQLLVIVAGTLLGLLTGLGLSAPATAAAPSSVSAASNARYAAGLDLRYNGKFIVRGEGYKAKKVYVKVVRVTQDGKNYVVAHKHLPTRNGSFEWSGTKLPCGKTYQAHSYSYKDDWASSRTLQVRC